MGKGKIDFDAAVSKSTPTTNFKLEIDHLIEQDIEVTLDDVTPYKDNPRFIENPAYQDIKSSIQARGLDTVLTITKRLPNDEKYILSDGGGTRYKILRELWNETGDDRYFRHNMKFKPYVSELDLLIRHASENGNRAGINWVESALQADKITNEIKSDLNRDKISTRELAKIISEQGWSIRHPRLGEYQYTTSTLYQSIPKALNAGAGRPKIRTIKDIDSKYRKQIADRDMTERDYDLFLYKALKSSDSEIFDTKIFENNLIALLPAFKPGADVLRPFGDPVIAAKQETTSSTTGGDTSNGDVGASSGSTGTSSPSNVIGIASNAIRIDAGEGINNSASKSISIPDKCFQLAENLMKEQCPNLSKYLVDVRDDFTVSLGFAVTTIDEDVDPTSIDLLESLIYFKLNRYFGIGFDAQSKAGQLDDMDSDDLEHAIEVLGPSVITQNSYWYKGLLLSMSDLNVSLSIQSQLGKFDDEASEKTFNALRELQQYLTAYIKGMNDMSTKP